MIRFLLIGLVKGYRLLLSPWLGSACRFEPTCSAYSLQALQLHGAAKGSYLTLRRLGRCHPWCAGGHDPVPGTLFPLASVAAVAPHEVSSAKSTT
jgi:putative membrane protein insertion efficiency factor